MRAACNSRAIRIQTGEYGIQIVLITHSYLVEKRAFSTS